MQENSWHDTDLKIEDYRISIADGHQLQLRRCSLEVSGATPGAELGVGRGVPVLMVAGFLSDASVYFPADTEAGLARFLAAAGFDVFVAELRGKGGSWPSIHRNWNTGLHHSIMEDIPAHLCQIAKLRPGEPQLWIGQGLGSILLAGCYARLDILPAPVIGMVHFGAGRYCELASWRKTFAHSMWRWRCALSCFLHGFVIRGMGEKNYRESRPNFVEWCRWSQSVDWLDPIDQFDYRDALRQKGMPPALYFAAHHQILWGSMESSRLWIQELGNHDARLVGLSKAFGNLRNYTLNTMLTSTEACSDHFNELLTWVKERQIEWLSCEKREFRRIAGE